MTYTSADELTPDVISLYRRARFGEAGRFGAGGVAKAGAHHGVGARAWFHYESGKRTPSITERQKIARWLNSHAASSERVQTLVDVSVSE